MLSVAAFAKSLAGVKRSHNEDSHAVNSELGFYLAADGMGGEAAGELASRVFSESAQEVFSRSDSRAEEARAALVREAFGLAHDRILDHVRVCPEHEGMGCTAELLALTDTGFVLGHIGDSRAYRLRDGELRRLTKDHSVVQDQMDQGMITLEDARRHPLRHVIHRAVGVGGGGNPDLLTGRTLSGDLFLLCSDGLSDSLEDAQIGEILSAPMPLEEKADTLISAARSAGARDDITVILLAVP